MGPLHIKLLLYWVDLCFCMLGKVLFWVLQRCVFWPPLLFSIFCMEVGVIWCARVYPNLHSSRYIRLWIVKSLRLLNICNTGALLGNFPAIFAHAFCILKIFVMFLLLVIFSHSLKPHTKCGCGFSILISNSLGLGGLMTQLVDVYLSWVCPVGFSHVHTMIECDPWLLQGISLFAHLGFVWHLLTLWALPCYPRMILILSWTCSMIIDLPWTNY